MSQRALHFLEIPTRSAKPRGRGLTLARDYGIGYSEAEDWMESVGAFIDYIKLRHIFTLTAPLDPNHLLMRKVKLYAVNQIDVNPGGIVFEIAHVQSKVDRTFETLRRMGFTAVECSENIVPLSRDDKVGAVRRAKAHGLKVLFEVGEKYPEGPIDVDMAVADIAALLEVDCDLVIIERSLIEHSLGARGENKEARRLVELAKRVPPERIVWEAEAVPHQAWLIRTFGPDVNLGPNLEPNYIAKLEATRLSMSREGGYTWLSEKVKR
ncbi:MAG: phosphosulfolactate synthase [Proteobacteria bacterium]|nr:phosphosulfolactate synthase [Pseudomonadota bacterium]